MNWQRFETFCQRKTSDSFDNDNRLSLSGSLLFLQCFFFSKAGERKMERPICAIVLVGNKTFFFCRLLNECQIASPALVSVIVKTFIAFVF